MSSLNHSTLESNKRFKINFDGGDLSSDSGLLLIKEFMSKLHFDKLIGDFDGFQKRIDDLKHSYDKFRFSGDVYKPPFETIYESVKEYVKPLIPEK